MFSIFSTPAWQNKFFLTRFFVHIQIFDWWCEMLGCNEGYYVLPPIHMDGYSNSEELHIQMLAIENKKNDVAKIIIGKSHISHTSRLFCPFTSFVMLMCVLCSHELLFYACIQNHHSCNLYGRNINLVSFKLILDWWRVEETGL